MTNDSDRPSRRGNSAAADLGLLLLRLPLGAIFINAGWMKVHTMGVGNFVG